MSDGQVKGLLAAGLALQALAVALLATPLLAYHPLSVAAAGIALTAAALSPRVFPIALGVVAVAAWPVLLPSGAATWAVRIVFGLEAGVQIALLTFLLTFKMKRLW